MVCIVDNEKQIDIVMLRKNSVSTCSYVSSVVLKSMVVSLIITSYVLCVVF